MALLDELTGVLQSRDCEIANVWQDEKGRWQAAVVCNWSDTSSTQIGTPKYSAAPDLYQAMLETFTYMESNMNIFSAASDIFNYWDGSMVAQKPVTMTIKDVQIEKVESQKGLEDRPVLYFEESKKGAVLGNKTNIKALAIPFGAETEGWVGKRVTLFAEHGRWFGKEAWALRVRPAANGATA